MSFNTLSFSKAMAGLAMVSIALATPLKQETSLLGKAIPLQSIFLMVHSYEYDD